MYHLIWASGGWDSEAQEPVEGGRCCGSARSAEEALDLAEQVEQWAAVSGWEDGEVVILDDRYCRVDRSAIVSHYFRLDRSTRQAAGAFGLN